MGFKGRIVDVDVNVRARLVQGSTFMVQGLRL